MSESNNFVDSPFQMFNPFLSAPNNTDSSNNQIETIGKKRPLKDASNDTESLEPPTKKLKTSNTIENNQNIQINTDNNNKIDNKTENTNDNPIQNKNIQQDDNSDAEQKNNTNIMKNIENIAHIQQTKQIETENNLQNENNNNNNRNIMSQPNNKYDQYHNEINIGPHATRISPYSVHTPQPTHRRNQRNHIHSNIIHNISLQPQSNRQSFEWEDVWNNFAYALETAYKYSGLCCWFCLYWAFMLVEPENNYMYNKTGIIIPRIVIMSLLWFAFWIWLVLFSSLTLQDFFGRSSVLIEGYVTMAQFGLVLCVFIIGSVWLFFPESAYNYVVVGINILRVVHLIFLQIH